MLGLIKSLPKYHGPYKVSTIELEIPCAHQEFGTAVLKQTGECALQLDSAQALVFYPADEHKRGSGTRQPWASRPLAATAKGYSAFTGAPAWLLRAVLVILARRIKLPVEADVPLASPRQSTADAAAHHSSSSTLVDADTHKGIEGMQQQRAPVANTQFPLIVFSHGLGGTRTTYSQYCGELASLGYIVAAVEHRDGTAPVSTVKFTDGRPDRQVLYIRPQDIEFKGQKLSQLEYRKQQLEMRYEEVRQVLGIFERLNDGQGDEIARSNLRKTKGSETWLPQWQGKIDVRNSTCAGHSFGGATTLQILRAGNSFPFVQGIALDPWIDPIPKLSTLERFTSPAGDSTDSKSSKPTTTPKEQLDIKVPLLTINSEAFTKWSDHYLKVYEIVKRVQNSRAWYTTLVGSVHMSFSDFPLLSPFIARKSGSRVDPQLGMTLFVEASREFLGRDDKGTILGRQVQPGDENGTRPNEGKGGEPMSPVGDMRMHFRPKESRL
ncbi:hypothetical protein ACM66B_000688 [Microbotryomycetes sp. NB124-2]